VGKRQRHTDLIPYSDEEVKRLARDGSIEAELRRKFQQEEKFRRRRNRRKRER